MLLGGSNDIKLYFSLYGQKKNQRETNLKHREDSRNLKTNTATHAVQQKEPDVGGSLNPDPVLHQLCDLC